MTDRSIPSFLDFERPIAELEGKIEELRHLGDVNDLEIADEVQRLQQRIERMLRQTYGKLTPWQIVQVARHPARPHCVDYLRELFDGLRTLAGDRLYAEDAAIIGGIGRFRGRSVVVIGQEKGAEIESRMKHNFGMARPEGYRKAQRLMRLADRFGLPVVTLVDTPGAYPGIGAEERGQAEAIARSIETCLSLRVPAGKHRHRRGAAPAARSRSRAANTVLMLQHSIYSVISPEGCASILWRDGDHARRGGGSAQADGGGPCGELGVVDTVIEEPLGGAHRAPADTVARVGDGLAAALDALAGMDADALVDHRRRKFLDMGTASLS